MDDFVVRVENLGKLYRIGAQQEHYKTLRESLVGAVTRPFNRLRNLRSSVHNPQSAIRNPQSNYIWALKDVSFEVKQGEVVGIIGRNGAGKSTLLKVLSHITEPTEGRVTLSGRVGSLLEVGTGFHPELTGRENIYLNGSILGMKRVEIDLRFDEIVAFAEIERFLDTPVKHYSSGMYVRLAFAVAAHLEPEILLVDEVLAVGDAAFQKKCLGKMGDVAKEGRTVLFVTHNMGAVARLCPRSMLLSEGVVVFDGGTDVAVMKYLKNATPNTTRRARFADEPNLPIVIREVAVTSPDRTDTEPLDVMDPITVEVHYRVNQDTKGANVSLSLKREGVAVLRTWDIDSDDRLFHMRRCGDYVAKVSFPSGVLTIGLYSLLVGIGRSNIGIIDSRDDCVSFEIESLSLDTTHLSLSRGGLINLPLSWETNPCV